MATQTIEIRSEHAGETNTICLARNPSTAALVQSSATLAAPDASGVRYYPVFTDLPAGEYLFVLESSAGEELTYGWATVTLTTATFVLQGEPEAERAVEVGSLTQAALAQFATDDTGETSAATGSVSKISQGSTGADYTDQLDRIEAKTALITGAGINVVSPVTQTGDLISRIGDDDVGADALPVFLPGGAGDRLALIAEDVSKIYFVARRTNANDIRVEVAKASILEPNEEGKVFAMVEIPVESKPTVTGVYTTSLLIERTNGKVKHKTIGRLFMEEQIGSPVEA